MRLTLKDLGATLIVAALGAMAWAYFNDQAWPVVSGPRVLSVVAFVFGVAACATGARNMVVDQKSLEPGDRLLRVHGLAALGLAIAGAITGNEVVLIILLSIVGAMWLLATVRHLGGFPAAPAS